MKFSRRLRLYLTGVFLGLIMVWFMLIRGRDRDMDAWLPNERVMTDLRTHPLRFSDQAICRMGCRNIRPEEIQEVLTRGEVNFSKSDPHEEPCKTYAVDATLESGRGLRIVFGDCDTLTNVLTAIDLDSPDDNCSCL